MEEISLRELIEILLKRRKIIIGCTTFALTIALAVSFFFMTPIYEAVTVLNVQNLTYDTHSGNVNSTNVFLNNDNIDWKELSQLDSGITQDSRALISSLIQYPSMTEEAYKNKLLGYELLTKVKDAVPSLKDNSIEGIKGKINIETKNGLFTVKVKDPNPQDAAAIGNTLAEAFVSYIDKYNNEHIKSLNKYITSAMEKQEKDMTDIDAELEKAEAANDKNKAKQLEIKHDISKQIYEVLLFKEEQLNLIQMMDFGDKNVAIVRKAYEPEKPIAPNKKLNVAIAGVLGLMLGVFAAFFIEYWKTSGDELQKSNASID